MFVREDWHPVLLYDEDADIDFLRSVVENISKFEEGSTELARLVGAENSIRAEKILFTDPGFDQKLTDILQTLSRRLPP